MRGERGYVVGDKPAAVLTWGRVWVTPSPSQALLDPPVTRLQSPAGMHSVQAGHGSKVQESSKASPTQ